MPSSCMDVGNGWEAARQFGRDRGGVFLLGEHMPAGNPRQCDGSGGRMSRRPPILPRCAHRGVPSGDGEPRIQFHATSRHLSIPLLPTSSQGAHPGRAHWSATELRRSRMRITCSKTERGNVYRFYRDDARFHEDLRPLIPLLRACEGDLLIGDPEGADALMVLEVWPAHATQEAELLRLARRHLVESPDPRLPGDPRAAAAARCARGRGGRRVSPRAARARTHTWRCIRRARAGARWPRRTPSAAPRRPRCPGAGRWWPGPARRGRRAT